LQSYFLAKVEISSPKVKFATAVVNSLKTTMELSKWKSNNYLFFSKKIAKCLTQETLFIVFSWKLYHFFALELNSQPLYMPWQLPQKGGLEYRWALTRPEHTFDPQVNKTRVLFDPTRWHFFWPEGEKIEKIDIFRGNFPNPYWNHRWLTWPEPLKLTRPGSKIFDPDPSLVWSLLTTLEIIKENHP